MAFCLILQAFGGGIRHGIIVLNVKNDCCTISKSRITDGTLNFWTVLSMAIPNITSFIERFSHWRLDIKV